MRIDITRVLWVTAVGLLAVGLAVLIWDPSSSGGIESGGTDQVVEHMDDMDDHGDADAQADGVDEHEDADSHDDSDEDAEASGYLETAPKDALALVVLPLLWSLILRWRKVVVLDGATEIAGGILAHQGGAGLNHPLDEVEFLDEVVFGVGAG